ncbi:MAG: PhoH family protein [Candidatus Zixiibacteriota bacterium]
MATDKSTIIKEFDLHDIDQRILFGQNDKYSQLIESQFNVKIIARGEKAMVEGKDNEVKNVILLFNDMTERMNAGHNLTERYLRYAIDMVKEEGRGPAESLNGEINNAVTRIVKARTLGQKKYLEAIDKFDIVFSIGPAGTGKTYLAVAQAVAELKKKSVKRIILVRPAVEAGESLGFLPGDIKAKIDPYLRPVYDALHELMPAEKITKLIDLGVIEICPLAFMRGRTLNRSFVILDEAQNTTLGQMKMFLTRLGDGSKSIITGDITQIDLDKKIPSGLVKIRKILEGIKGIEFVYLTPKDVVRHRLVQDIINAYARYEDKAKRAKGN